jgi:hypothetical protein
MVQKRMETLDLMTLWAPRYSVATQRNAVDVLVDVCKDRAERKS